MTLTDRTRWEPTPVTAGVLALALAAALTAAVVVAAPVAAQDPPPNAPCPSDIPEADFVDRGQARTGHAPSIDCVAFHAIAVGSTDSAGDPVYLPAGTVNRAQMATFIANSLQALGAELPDGDAPDEFTDIAGTVHRARINALAGAEIVSGFPDGAYRPNQAVSRAQMATFIVQAAEWVLAEDLEADSGPYFADTEGNTHEANIDAGFEAGLYDGRVAPEPDTPRSGRYAPRDQTRRDQMATFLSRLLDRLWQESGIAGVVTNAETGDPIPGALVTIRAEPIDPEGDPVIANTDERGVYLAALDDGTYTVTAVADDFEDPEARTGITVTGDELTIVNFALQPFTPPTEPDLGVVHGRVAEADTQAPVEDATVTVLADDTEVDQTTADALGNYSLSVEPGTYTVTADAPGYLPATEDDTTVTADAFTRADFDLLFEPGAAILTPDRMLAPTSPTADPGVSTPSRGDVNFELGVYDDEGGLLDPDGRPYTFSIINDGGNPIFACIFCGEGDDSTEIMMIDSGGIGRFEDVPGRNRIRIDASDPASVTVIASTTVDGETRGASASTQWTSVHEAPTGQGTSESLVGTILAYDLDADWYFFSTAEDINVFVEYTNGTSDAYLIGFLDVSVAQFEEALTLGAEITYITDETDSQLHWLTASP